MSCQEWRGMEGVLQAGSLQDVAPSFLKVICNGNLRSFQHFTFLCDCDQDSYFHNTTWCVSDTQNNAFLMHSLVSDAINFFL